MKAAVVYESLWGNTAAVAHATVEGLGCDAHALTTDEATPAVLAGVDLLVVGAPVIAFGLASEKTRAGIKDAGHPPDTEHPSLKSWLEELPGGHASAAAFETRLWWSPRGATGAIERGLKGAGYVVAGKAQRFIVDGKYGPLRDGELERAREWGKSLADAAGVAVEAA
jgi:hypothetical protein